MHSHLDGSRIYNVVQVRDGAAQAVEDMVAVEELFELYVDGDFLRDFEASPDDLRSLALGHLYIEERIQGSADVESIEFLGQRIYVGLKAGAERGGILPPPEIRTTSEKLWRQIERMEEEIELFQATGGVHGGALWDEEGRLQAEAWDVARHNVIDKLCGQVLAKGLSPRGMTMTFSGRQARAIVEKALAMEVSILAGISAPTSLGIDAAQAGGLTLAGFVRPGRMNLYAHPQRIALSEAPRKGPFVVTVTAAKSGSGKTSFISNLITALKDKLRIGVLKSSSHPYTMNASKDSGRFYKQGAELVVYQGSDGLHSHYRGAGDPMDLVRTLAPKLDLLLIESRGIRKGLVLEIVRGEEGVAAYRERARADRIVTDRPDLFPGKETWPLNDPERCGQYLMEKIEKGHPPLSGSL